MGKRIATCLILLVLMAPVAVVAATGEINVAIDGVLINFGDVRPTEYNGHILVPVRPVFERLDFHLEWVVAGEREIAILHREGITIQITLGEMTFMINEMTRPLETSARRVGGTVIVPIRTLVESIGMTVEWDELSNVMIIRSPVEPVGLPQGMIPLPGHSPDFLPSGPPAGFRNPPPGVGPSGPGNVVVAPPVVHVPAIIHVVRPNETLSQIARDRFPQLDHDNHRIHNEAIDQIVRDNPIIRDRNRIRVDWELRIYPFGTVPIPVPTAEDISRAAAAREFPHLPQTHRIAPGENLTLIAMRYFPTLNLDTDIDLRLSVIAQIARDNDIENPHRIVSGTYITIYPFVR